MLLGLSGTSDGTVVAAEGDALPVGLDVLEVGDSLGELEVVKGSGGLAKGGKERSARRFRRRSSSSGAPGVLVVNTEVSSLRDSDGLAVLDELRVGVAGL